MSRLFFSLFVLAALILASGCEAGGDDASPLEIAPSHIVKVEAGKSDSSAEAIFIDLRFAGEVWTDTSWRPEGQIEDQLLFTIGHLNGDKAVGRLDRLELSDVATEAVDGKTRITYQASLPVAWAKSKVAPSTYDLRLPRDISYAGQEAFADKYGESCVDWGAHDVDAGSMWYYYRPRTSRCRLDGADVFDVTAEVTPSSIQTTGKYPEYDMIWADGVLEVVAVFGKYEDGATSTADAGIRAWNSFHQQVRRVYRDYEVTPADASDKPGVETDDITYRATVGGDRQIVITALLVDNVRTAPREFDERYAALSRTADLIIYNGHAGLGANIRALARKGEWAPAQYTIVFMNGCDTYAYVDDALFEAHAAVNPDDPEGTKYTDIVTNALPAYFRSMTEATLAMIRGLAAYDDPRTYETIFRDVDEVQVVLVTGEHDNTFVPGGADLNLDPIDGSAWAGLREADVLAGGEERRFATPQLTPGTYTFTMSGDGDADLYVRVGLEPTTQSYDCRPYRAGSDEICQIDLPSPAVVHVLVQGFSASSSFELVAAPN